jgi:hypothetical protein
MTEPGNEKYSPGHGKEAEERGSSTKTGQITWQHPTGQKTTVRELENS